MVVPQLTASDRRHQQLEHCITSAKTGAGVEELFNKIVEKLNQAGKLIVPPQRISLYVGSIACFRGHQLTKRTRLGVRTHARGTNAAATSWHPRLQSCRGCTRSRKGSGRIHLIHWFASPLRAHLLSLVFVSMVGKPGKPSPPARSMNYMSIPLPAFLMPIQTQLVRRSSLSGSVQV